jgi:hypothetical protein
MTISKTICIRLILEKFPEFQHNWEIYKQWWGNLESGFYNDISEFSHYIIDLLILKNSNPEKLKEIFDYVEYLIVHGDEDVQNAISTCLLENILNQTPEKIHPNQFVPYLGHKSREHCKAWDQFTGVKTEGLW